MNQNWMDGHKALNIEALPMATEPQNFQAGTLDLNVIVAEQLASFKEDLDHLKAIIRYDVLPCINGSRGKVSHLFSNIISSIVKYPPALTKLIVYFRSQEASPEVMDLTLPDGFKLFTISIFTNIQATENWRLKNSTLIADCAAIIKSLEGTFATHFIVNTGCLYALHLPGKMN